MLRRFWSSLHAYCRRIPVMGRVFGFRRRTKLVLGAVAGIILGWIGLEVRYQWHQERAAEAVELRGGLVVRSVRTGGLSAVLGHLSKYGVRFPRFRNHVYEAEISNVQWDPPSAEDLELLHAFPELTQLRLRGAQVTDAAMAKLVGLHKLGKLTLVNAAITEQGLKSLTQLPGLRTLSLENCTCITAELVRQLPNLRQLSLQSCHGLTPELLMAIREAHPALRVECNGVSSIPPVKMLPEATSLSFWGPLQTDTTLAATLKHARSLTQIYFYNCGVTDEGLRSLRSHPQLTSLSFSRDSSANQHRSDPQSPAGSVASPITDAGLEHISQLSHLTHLTVVNYQITDRGLQSIGRLARLQFLELNGAEISDAGLQHLRPLLDLGGLYLRGAPITDEGMHELQAFKKLRGLSLADTQVTDQGLAEIARHLSLRGLNLSGTCITDAGIARIADMKSLRHLDLHQTQISDQCIEDLCRLPLEKLLVYRTQMTEQGLARLRKQFGESALK